MTASVTHANDQININIMTHHHRVKRGHLSQTTEPTEKPTIITPNSEHIKSGDEER